MSETFTIGEATERFSGLDGLRVVCLESNEAGTVYNCYINRKSKLAQIWVNMDSGGARCFRPHHLKMENESEIRAITHLLDVPMEVSHEQ